MACDCIIALAPHLSDASLCAGVGMPLESRALPPSASQV